MRFEEEGGGTREHAQLGWKLNISEMKSSDFLPARKDGRNVPKLGIEKGVVMGGQGNAISSINSTEYKNKECHFKWDSLKLNIL